MRKYESKVIKSSTFVCMPPASGPTEMPRTAKKGANREEWDARPGHNGPTEMPRAAAKGSNPAGKSVRPPHEGPVEMSRRV